MIVSSTKVPEEKSNALRNGSWNIYCLWNQRVFYLRKITFIHGTPEKEVVFSRAPDKTTHPYYVVIKNKNIFVAQS